MKLHDSAPERNVSPEEALAHYDAHSKGFICSFCGKRSYEQEDSIEGPDVSDLPELRICFLQCIHLNKPMEGRYPVPML